MPHVTAHLSSARDVLREIAARLIVARTDGITVAHVDALIDQLARADDHISSAVFATKAAFGEIEAAGIGALTTLRANLVGEPGGPAVAGGGAASVLDMIEKAGGKGCGQPGCQVCGGKKVAG